MVAALFLPNWAVFLPKIHAAGANMMQSAPPDDNLPDLDAQQMISPSDPQALDPDPSTAEAWQPLDPDPDGSSAIKVTSSVTITSPSEGASFSVSTPVTFSANVSSDAAVIQVSFMANGKLVASDKAAPYSATYSLLAAGTYTLTAVAMLSTGGSLTSNPVHITITSPTTPPPSVAITSPASGASFTAPASIPLVATATAASGRTISSVQFFRGTTLIGTGSLVSSTYQYTWSGVAVGAYAVTAKATDSSGAATTSAAISVTVNAAAGPSVTLTVSPTHVPVSTPVTLTAAASASAGRTISRVDFYANGVFLNTDTSSPYSISWTPTQSIAYSLTAVATDNMGATATSAPQALTIDAPAGNPTVAFSSPASGQHFHSPASVVITVTAAAGSGRSITKVDFYADGSTTAFSTDTSSPYNATFSSSVAGTHTLTAKATDSASATTSMTISIVVDSPAPPPDDTTFSTARLDPANRTGLPGEDLFSGNYNWSLPLMGLAGRAGLDLGLGLSYNSLVWTKDGGSIKFNADNGYPGPGFRLGLPVIQDQFANTQTGGYSYLMITPSGAHIDLRQVGSTDLYESADSSYMQFDAANLIARTSDGTQMTFELDGYEYHCTQVKDRNGNYITATYNGLGHIQTMTDTLGRTLTFDYDAFENLIRIRQQWNGADHVLATFSYASLTISVNFGGNLTVEGVPLTKGFQGQVLWPPDGITTSATKSPLPVLSKVSLDDGSSYTFDYTTYGQVYRISHFAADGHQLSHTTYDLVNNTSAVQADCPRFTSRLDYAEHWNNGNEVRTGFATLVDTARTNPSVTYGQVVFADGTVYLETCPLSGYKKGLVTQAESRLNAGSTTDLKSRTTNWTQDNEALSYPANPRPTVTVITDDAGNNRRSTVGYQTFTLPSGVICALPITMDEYAADQTTVLRRTQTTYNLGTAYVSGSRRLLGLPDFRYVYEGPGTTLVSKTGYTYDESAYLQAASSTPVNHDESGYGYGTGIVQGRGNLSTMTRFDVTAPTSTSLAAQFTTKYDTAGNVTVTTDPSGHHTTISYIDNFATTATSHPGAAVAYPTSVSDADSFSRTAQYDYDLGAVRQTTDPKGAIRTTTYDGAGRLSRTDINSGAYTRYVYATSMTQVSTYTLIQTGQERFSLQQLDGAGRVTGAASVFPGSTGGYRGQYTSYDVMGRVSSQSNPTEMNSGWGATGDDSTWVYTTQTYDWKGRPVRTTNPDATFHEFSYGGCGCAGGEQVTATDEAGRQSRTTYDILDRVAKVETFNFGQTTAYATTGYTYNGRDQVLTARQYQGGDTSTTHQDTVMTYDGHGRLASRKLPSESAACTYAYNPDDTLQSKTDARGATAGYTYNPRHLLTNITYGKPGHSFDDLPPDAIPLTPTPGFTYDAAGNRLTMSDGQGSTTYTYDTWSRLTSETRQITGVGSFALQYGYNQAGELITLTDAFNQQVDYAYNQAGELTGLNFNNAAFVSNLHYRAWGARKQMDSANGLSETMSYNSRMQVTQYKVQAAGTALMGYDYLYTSDNGQLPGALVNEGRVRFARDLTGTSSSWDRSFSYDQTTARLTGGKSGSEARNEAVPATGPYLHTYGYDAFGNLTLRTGRNGYIGPASVAISYGATYVNDRNQAWTYNGSGNVVDTRTPAGSTAEYEWDTAGQLTRSDALDGSGAVTASYAFTYDGDGQKVSQVVGGVATYYVHSMVMGGQVVNEVNNNGTTQRTNIYANGELVGRKKNNNLYWTNKDPASLTYLETDSTRTVFSRVQYDPLGVITGTGQNIPPPGSGGTPVNPVGYYGNPNSPGDGCTLDGAPFPCDWLARMINGGTAVKCPNNDCGPSSFIQYINGVVHSETLLTPFHPEADGKSSFVPVTARFNADHTGWYDPVTHKEGSLRGSDNGSDLQDRLIEVVFQVPNSARNANIGRRSTDNAARHHKKRGTPPVPLHDLDDCVKKVLAKYFDSFVLDAATIDENGTPWYIMPWFVGYTDHDKVYFEPGKYDPHSAAGIALIAHELVHVGQYNDPYNTPFEVEYLLDSVYKTFSAQGTYRSNRFEKEAYDAQFAIADDLRARFGSTPCPKSNVQ